jgi:hypothetical protein
MTPLPEVKHPPHVHSAEGEDEIQFCVHSRAKLVDYDKRFYSRARPLLEKQRSRSSKLRAIQIDVARPPAALSYTDSSSDLRKGLAAGLRDTCS